MKSTPKALLWYYVSAIIIDCRPYCLGNSIGFKTFFEKIKFQVPDRHTVSELVPKITSELKLSIHQLLTNINSITITVDHWSSTNYQFFCILGYYINADFNSKCVLLNIPSVLNKLALTTRRIIQTTITEYRINIKYAVSDGATDLKSCFNGFPNISQIICYAHRIHLAIIHALEDSQLMEIIEKFNCLTCSINHRSTFYRDFSMFLRGRKLGESDVKKYTKRIPSFIVTRWNSLNDQLMAYKECFLLIKMYMECNGLWISEKYPDESEHNLITAILPELSILKECQLSLSIPFTGSLSKIITRLSYSKDKIECIMNESCEINDTHLIIFKRFSHSLIKMFGNKNYLDVMRDSAEYDIVLIASFLNPLNVKMLQSEENYIYFSNKISNTTINDSYNLKRKRDNDVIAKKIFICTENNESINEDTSVIDSYIDICKNYSEKYINESNLSLIETYDHFNPLKFWNENKKNIDKIKKIQCLVKQYLNIEATEVSCERLFRYGSIIDSDLRGSLSSESISNSLFLIANKEILLNYLENLVE